MRLSIEQQGLVSAQPRKLVDALLAIARVEGADERVFLDDLAKAAGGTKSSVHANERSNYALFNDIATEARDLYGTAMTLALSEIHQLISDRLSAVSRDRLRQTGRP